MLEFTHVAASLQQPSLYQAIVCCLEVLTLLITGSDAYRAGRRVLKIPGTMQINSAFPFLLTHKCRLPVALFYCRI